ncbi:hypothetical protein [Micromonospora inositola]|uniref:hypothetical protein n=1 Tax=Micromonospora inositola TaxID=47865 RepID=UPI001E64AE68|nr:hypothetical protein [Micromonospora inositola]
MNSTAVLRWVATAPNCQRYGGKSHDPPSTPPAPIVSIPTSPRPGTRKSSATCTPRPGTNGPAAGSCAPDGGGSVVAG